MKKSANLILSFLNNFFIFSSKLFEFFLISSFKSNTLLSVKERYLSIEVIIIESNEEYIICGIWYGKLYEPLSSYILCIVSSLKNNALIDNSVAKKKKNNNIFIILEL